MSQTFWFVWAAAARFCSSHASRSEAAVEDTGAQPWLESRARYLFDRKILLNEMICTPESPGCGTLKLPKDFHALTNWSSPAASSRATGDVDLQLALRLHASLSPALGAGIAEDRARAAAGATQAE